MKTLIYCIVLFGLLLPVRGQQAPPPPPIELAPLTLSLSNSVTTNLPPAGTTGEVSAVTMPVTNTVPTVPEVAPLTPPAAASTNDMTAVTNQAPPVAFAPPPTMEASAIKLGEDQLQLNFRSAPVDLVLNQLSTAAGFIIELQTPVRGVVDIISNQPVTKDEAVDLLNSMLNRNGYTAVRNGRKLTIMTKQDALHGNIPVKSGNDPESIPKNDEIVTQIIPVRFVEALQLAKDLAPMVSPQAMIVANEAANSIALTDTQANIRHLVEIIKAIDSSAEDETQLRVFALKYADPNEMADLLMALFPDQGTSGGGQTPVRFGGGPPGGPGGGRFSSFLAAMGGGGAASSGGAQQRQRIRKRLTVIAVADPRTSSVAVTAAKDLMEQIATVIEQLDFRSNKETTVNTFRLNNADPQEVLPLLQDMFQGANATRSSRSTQNSPLMNRVQQNQNTSTSTSGIRIGGGVGTGSRGSTGGGF
jgi:general secretion pathway protein D